MSLIIKYGKTLIITTISLLIALIINTTLYYFNIISTNVYQILEITILLINILITTFILGKKASKKGYLEGLKFSLIIIPLFFILTLLTQEPIQLKLIIYYIIIIITSVLGSMLGINNKNSSN